MLILCAFLLNVLAEYNRIVNNSDKDKSANKLQQQTKSSNAKQMPPIFHQVTQLSSNEPSLHLPRYYPLDNEMLSLAGPIPLFCPQRVKLRTSYYMPANRQTFEYVVEHELLKSTSGPIVIEKAELLNENKSFRKLIGKLRKHFPNLSV